MPGFLRLLVCGHWYVFTSAVLTIESAIGSSSLLEIFATSDLAGFQ